MKQTSFLGIEVIQEGNCLVVVPAILSQPLANTGPFLILRGQEIGRPAVSGTVINSTSLTGIVVPPVLFGVRGRVRALNTGTRPGV